MGDSNPNVGPTVFCISGYKNTGKTTLMVQLVERLTQRGWRVGTIKHDGHSFEPDQKGRDSQRHFAAGAVKSVVFADGLFQMVERRNCSLEELISHMGGVDFVLVEGMKDSVYPKYVCDYPNRIPNIDELICELEERRREEVDNRDIDAGDSTAG